MDKEQIIALAEKAKLFVVRNGDCDVEDLLRFLESYKAELLKEVGEPVYFEWRHCDTSNDPNGIWSEWKKVEPRNAYVNTVEDSVAEFDAYIAQGYKYELRKLFTSDQVAAAVLKATGPLEEENAELHEQVDMQIPKLAFAQLQEKLAASQVYAEQLRSIIWETNQYIDQTYSDLIGNLSSEWLAASYIDDLSPKLSKALALPRDTSALDAYVAKRLHDMACDKGLLRIQVEELTRQRDLAVEAIRHCIAAMGSVPDVKKAMDWPQLHNAQMLSLQALDAIKESEGKGC